MNKDNLITLIDNAYTETDIFVEKYYDGDQKPMRSTKKTLLLLKEEVINNQEGINERVLRAIHDIGVIAFRQFENTPLEDRIEDMIDYLHNNIPEYKDLEPLGMDFGKGNPV
jgi:hypothetical protein